MQPMDQELTIPTWLQRGHPDCSIMPLPDPRAPTSRAPSVATPTPTPPAAKPRRLRAAAKDRIALAVIGRIEDGHDTFGKLRKAMPDVDERDLRSGLRHAKRWQRVAHAQKRRVKHAMTGLVHRTVRVEIDGRRYKVVEQ